MKIELDFSISENIWQLLNLLEKNGGAPRFVGGIVRDILYKEISQNTEDNPRGNTDIDIATKLKPDELMSLFEANDVKFVDIGSEFGTVIAVIDGQNIEITTLRLDINCDGRHAEVEFTDDFKEDAKRRDFTINAMSYCPYNKEIYDYFGGVEDLKAGIVRFIGKPAERIKEDHLRILRFFRFSDRYSINLDNESYEACLENLGLVKGLSAERILLELTKMIQSKTSSRIFSIMQESKLLSKIFGDIELDFELLSQMEITDYNLRFAALLNKAEAKVLSQLLKNLRFSKKDMKQIQDLVQFRHDNGDLQNVGIKSIKPLFLRLWIDNRNIDLFSWISLACRNRSFSEIMQITNSDTKPQFPIDGNDLIGRGLKGPEISKAIDKLKHAWIESEFKLIKDDLLSDV